jgi:uncharacterized protein
MEASKSDEMNLGGFNPVIQDRPEDKDFPSSMSPVMFLNNGQKLFGTIFKAAGPEAKPTVLMLSGFPGNELNHDIARMFQRFGFNAMTFNYSGSWGSEGEYSFQNILDDTFTAVNFLKSDFCREKFKVDTDKIILFGYSMGGFSALFNAARIDSIKNVIAVAPFNAGMFGQVLESNMEIKEYAHSQMIDAMNFVNNGSAENLLNEMISNKEEWNLLTHLKSLAQKNIIIFGARYDSIAPLAIHHTPLTENLKMVNPNSEVILLEAGHSFSNKRIELMELIFNWVKQIRF